MAENEQRTKVRLLFLGSPLLDITAPCDRETLEAYGLKSDDCVRETERHGPLFRSLLDDREGSRLSAGGSSQNSARVAKWTLGESAEVSFAGCVGADEFAAAMEERLRSEGVEPLYASLPGESTGICACLVTEEGTRSMCARLGAAEKFSIRHLEGIRQRTLRADLVYVEGYFLSHSPEVVIDLADNGPENEVLLSMSLSAEYICRDYVPLLTRILPRIDVLLSNEAEAQVLAKSLGFEDSTVDRVASSLAVRDRPPSAGRPPRIILVTRGPRPVLVARGSDPVLHFPVPTDIEIADTVGCGDALAGAFLAVYALTGDLEGAVRTGIAAATEIARVPGCNPPTGKKIYPA